MFLETCSLSNKTAHRARDTIELLRQFLLGRLPKVDLIILEGEKMSVRPYVRPSVRPQKVSLI